MSSIDEASLQVVPLFRHSQDWVYARPSQLKINRGLLFLSNFFFAILFFIIILPPSNLIFRVFP
jgi:hypothetical protein